MITKYPQTIHKLEEQGESSLLIFFDSQTGDTKNEIRRAQVDIEVKNAHAFSHKFYQYYKWYSSKSPTVNSRLRTLNLMFFLRFFQERTAVAQRVSIRLLPCPLSLLDHIQPFASTAPSEPILSSLTLCRNLRLRRSISVSLWSPIPISPVYECESWLHNEGRREGRMKEEESGESKEHRMNSMQTSFTGRE
jgi:hypothetical protein